MSKYKKILYFVALMVCFWTINIEALAKFQSGSAVAVPARNTVVDSVTMNGHQVNVVFRPYDGTNGTDTWYSCAAYVKRFYSDVFGISVYNLSSTTSVPKIESGGGSFSITNAPVKGDIVRDNQSVHWAIVKEVTADGKIIVAQQNAWLNDRTAAWVGAWTTISDARYTYFRYSGNTGESSTSSIFSSAGTATEITDTSAKISAKLNGTYNVSTCGFDIGLSPNAMGRVYENANTQVNSMWYSIGNGSKWYGTLQPGTTYYYRFYAIINGVEYTGAVQSFTTTGSLDTTPPVISNVQVTNKTKDGYTVTCTVTDNVGVNRVQFPTWTEANGQDDLMEDWTNNVLVSGHKNGSEYTFNVKTSEHNGEMGYYTTHIYAFDNNGNSSSAGVAMVIEDTPPTISNVKVTNISEAGYTVTCTITDNVGIDRVQFPTWTVANDQDDLASEWWTNPIVSGSINGSQATFHVRTGDHGNELGIYRTHIYAYDTCGNRTYYGVPDVKIEKVPVLQAPAKLTVELYGYDDVKLSWSKSTDADGYNIYYKKSTASKYTKLTSTTSLSCEKADLSDGIKYAFKVVPYYVSNGQKVESANSKAVSIYTLKKLAAPKITKASATQVKVSWTDISGESGYQLSVADSKTKTNIVSTLTAVSKTRTTTKNKTYYYKVRAYRTVDGKKIYGPWSDVKGYNLRNVSALSGLKAQLYGYDDVKLSWKKSTGANQYRIYYKKASDSNYTYMAKTTKNVYNKANLTDGVKYTFKVVPCYTVNGEVVTQGISKTISIYTLKKLSAPKISKMSSSQVKVTWNNISGESGYQISRSTSKIKTENLVTVATTSGISKSISVKKGTTYYYKVRVYKTVDGKKIYSPWSAVTSYKVK